MRTWNGWPCEDGSNYNATAERRRGWILWMVVAGAAVGLAIGMALFYSGGA
jgi:hypothetical protein